MPPPHETTTRRIEPDTPSPKVSPSAVTGVRYELGTAVVQVSSPFVPVAASDKEAILNSLYEERRRLTKAKRLGDLRPGDEEYLLDLNRYIDRLEAPQPEASADAAVLRQLDSLLSSLLSVQAKVERQR